MTSVGWASQMGVVVAWSSLGCGAFISQYTVQENFTASDGRVFRSDTAELRDGRVFQSGTAALSANGAAYDQALKASAAHDLPCPIDKVSVDPAPLSGALIGCGWRVVYREVDGPEGQVVHGQLIVEDKRLALLSRSPLTPRGDQPAPTSESGCSKDTDCKGDRICAQGQCADPAVKVAPSSSAPSAR